MRAASWFGFVRAWLPGFRSSQFARAFSQPTPTGAADSENVKLGIISDTHGLLRPEVLSALRGPGRTNWRQTLAAYTEPRVLQLLALGFSSGLPLLLTY